MYATANGRITVQVQPLQNNYSLVKLCDRVALITKALKRKGKGGRMARVQSGYFGFTTRDAANQFAAVINEKYGVDAIVRTASRLAGQEIEVKVRDFDGLETLCWEKAQKAEVTLQEARASLEVDFDEKFEPSAAFRAMQREWLNHYHCEDDPYGDEEDARADYEDLRTTSLPW
jgi:hypothetical protein